MEKIKYDNVFDVTRLNRVSLTRDQILGKLDAGSKLVITKDADGMMISLMGKKGDAFVIDYDRGDNLVFVL